MKRKTLKKALAGISAVAMLGTALPINMIAGAYSYSNVPATDTKPYGADSAGTDVGYGNSPVKPINNFGNMFADFKEAGVKRSAIAAVDEASAVASGRTDSTSVPTGLSTALTASDFTLANYDFRLTKYQTLAGCTIIPEKVVASNPIPEKYYIKEWDTAAAKADLIAYLDDVYDVEFYTDKSFPSLYGKIKTVTMEVPVNQNADGCGFGDIKYERIKFTVVRDSTNNDDFKNTYGNSGMSNTKSYILADSSSNTTAPDGVFDTTTGGLNAVGDMIQYNDNINLNLNGLTLKTNKGIQINRKTLRIWNGKIEAAGNSVNALVSYQEAANDNASIELYDGVRVTNSSSTQADNQATIAGIGKLVICGDNIVVTNGKDGALALATTLNVKKGNPDSNYDEYTVTLSSTTDAVNDIAKLNKVHNYNQWGVEVNDRTGTWSDSTDYYDTDIRKAGKQYGYQPAAVTGTKGADLSVEENKVCTVTNMGQLYWVAQKVNEGAFGGMVRNDMTYNDDTGYTLTIKIEADIDFAHQAENWTPMNFADDRDLGNVVIQGDATAKGHVLTGFKVATSDTNAAFIGKAGRVAETENKQTSCPAQTVTISGIGIENANVRTTAEEGVASALIAEGHKTTISYSYVLNPTLSGTYIGAMAGSLDNNSDIYMTYTSASYDAIYKLMDDATYNKLLTTRQLTYKGQTNFYNSDKIPANAPGYTKTYMKGATNKEFLDGKVAFMLNGHNPAQVITAGQDIVPWGTHGANDATASVAVNNSDIKTGAYTNGTPSNNTGGGYPIPDDKLTFSGAGAASGGSTPLKYSEDIFGQTIDGKKYPTFIKYVSGAGSNGLHAKEASNRVFRQISEDCSGNKAAWSATNAVFGNTEEDLSTTHQDSVNGTTPDGRCDHCGAYEIEKNFDPVLVPFLSSKVAADYNMSAANSKDGKWITLNTIAGLGAITIDLTKVADKNKKSVADIVDLINTVDEDHICSLKGFDILLKDNVNTTTKELTRTKSPIPTVNFMVENSIICKAYDDTAVDAMLGQSNATDDGEDISEIGGFRVANLDTDKSSGNNAYAVNASNTADLQTPGKGLPVSTSIDGAAVEVKASSSASDTNTTKKGFYVTAGYEKTSNKAIRFASFKSTAANFNADDAANGWTKPVNDYTFIVMFMGGVKHNSKFDIDTNPDTADLGGWNFSANGDFKTATIEYKTNAAGSRTDAKIHTLLGKTCGCEITENHKAVYTINTYGHQAKCIVCEFGEEDNEVAATGTIVDDGSATANNFNKHEFEVVYTFGNMAFKRCVVCGYATLTKDASIAAVSDKPTLTVQYDENDTAMYRQSYTFNVISGDDTIKSYGVIYSTDKSKNINLAKFAKHASTTYLHDDDAVLNTTYITDTCGLSYTSKKAITTNGTYTINKSNSSADAYLEVCGYVIYENADGTYGIEYTPVMKGTFRAAAQAEADESCSIEGRVSDTTLSSGKTGDKFNYTMELSNGWTAKSCGHFYSRRSGTVFTDETTYDMAKELEKTDSTTVSVKAKTPTKANAQIIYYEQTGVGRRTGVYTNSRGYMNVKNEKYPGLDFWVYSDVVTSATAGV